MIELELYIHGLVSVIEASIVKVSDFNLRTRVGQDVRFEQLIKVSFYSFHVNLLCEFYLGASYKVSCVSLNEEKLVLLLLLIRVEIDHDTSASDTIFTIRRLLRR